MKKLSILRGAKSLIGRFMPRQEQVPHTVPVPKEFNHMSSALYLRDISKFAKPGFQNNSKEWLDGFKRDLDARKYPDKRTAISQVLLQIKSAEGNVGSLLKMRLLDLTRRLNEYKKEQLDLIACGKRRKNMYNSWYLHFIGEAQVADWEKLKKHFPVPSYLIDFAYGTRAPSENQRREIAGKIAPLERITHEEDKGLHKRAIDEGWIHEFDEIDHVHKMLDGIKQLRFEIEELYKNN